MCVAMLMISAFATVVTASAAESNYTVTMLQSVGGTASYSSYTVASGIDSVHLTAIPDANYKFDHWEIDIDKYVITPNPIYGSSLTNEHLFIEVSDNITVTPHYVANNTSANNTANVKYSVEPTYMVNIPATVTLGSTSTISAEDVVVTKGKQVEITLTSTSEDDNSFKLKSAEGAEIEYTIKNNGSAVSLNDKVLIVNPDSSSTGDSTLSFVAPSGVTYAGSYTGTVTFNVAVGIA